MKTNNNRRILPEAFVTINSEKKTSSKLDEK
jgi:hypothetical protein